MSVLTPAGWFYLALAVVIWIAIGIRALNRAQRLPTLDRPIINTPAPLRVPAKPRKPKLTALAADLPPWVGLSQAEFEEARHAP